jgi:hypothetical protein
MAFKDFTEMTVWQKAFALLVKIYSITKTFPQEEKFAEGFGRFEKRDKTRFYKISRGSAYEIISQIMASYALRFINNTNEKNALILSYRYVIGELDSLIKTIEN